MHYGNTKHVLCIRKVYYTKKCIPNCDIGWAAYVKLKLIGKILTLLQQTWNRVVPLSSHKLHDRVFHSLSSRPFPFSWCTFVTSWTTQLYFCIYTFGDPFVQRPRQPPSLPNGSASPDKRWNLPSNVLQQITQVQKCVDQFFGRQLFWVLGGSYFEFNPIARIHTKHVTARMQSFNQVCKNPVRDNFEISNNVTNKFL